MNSNLNNSITRIPLLLIACVLFTVNNETQAQVIGRNVGVGGQIGEPSGITLKIYQRPGFAYDFLAAWDFDEYFLINVHGIFEHSLSDSPLNYYLGPGAFVTFRDRREDDVSVGISGNFGINFFVERFEVFLQITPRLNILPDTDGDLGGGVGLRYYL